MYFSKITARESNNNKNLEYAFKFSKYLLTIGQEYSFVSQFNDCINFKNIMLYKLILQTLIAQDVQVN